MLLAAVGAAGGACAGRLSDAAVDQGLRSGQPQAVIVQFRDAAPATGESAAARRQRRAGTKANVLRGLQAAHFEQRHDYGELPMGAYVLRRPEALERLLAHPDVEAVFPDRPMKLHLAESLPLVRQPAVAGTLGRRGAGTAVAVLDSGVDYTRPELGSCTAPGLPAASCKVVAAIDTAPDDGALDSAGHGTHVAEVVVAMAADARIVAVDVFNGSSAASSDIIAGIDWVVSHRVAYNIVAMNMSFGDGVNHTSACTSALADPFVTPLRTARNAGIVLVASSGNEGYTTGIASPACISEALSVGAVYDANVGGLAWSNCTDSSTAADRVTCFSDSGPMLDLLAPGALITVGGATIGGTSFSAPMVAGAAAVLKAQFPSETPAQIEARLIGTGKAVTDVRNGLSKPRLDVLAAQGAQANLSVSLASTPDPAAVGVTVSLTATVSNAGPQAADSVLLNFTLASGFAYLGGPALCSANGASVSCALGAIGAASSQSVTLLVVAQAEGALGASATASSSMADPAAADNTAAVSTNVLAAGTALADVPLPPWALAMLGFVLAGPLLRRSGDRPR